MSSPSLSTPSNEALALMAQYKRDAIEAQSSRAMSSRRRSRAILPGSWLGWTAHLRERLLIELFGYSEHVFAWVEDQRQAWQLTHSQGQASQPNAVRRQRRPSIKRMIAAAERSGKTVTSITTPDGVTLRFGESEPTEANNPWLVGIDDKVTKQ